MLRPPPLPATESMPQHTRHPSGSSRVGTALSDTGSISSSGSFQSAAVRSHLSNKKTYSKLEKIVGKKLTNLLRTNLW